MAYAFLFVFCKVGHFLFLSAIPHAHGHPERSEGSLFLSAVNFQLSTVNALPLPTSSSTFNEEVFCADGIEITAAVVAVKSYKMKALGTDMHRLRGIHFRSRRAQKITIAKDILTESKVC